MRRTRSAQKVDGSGPQRVGISGHRLEGRIVLADGRPAGDLVLRLYKIEFGGAELKLTETTTADDGRYDLPLDVEDGTAALELRAAPKGRKEIALTKPLYDLGDGELNLVAPISLRPLASEFERLVADLLPHVGDIKQLAGAREDDEQQDLTLLNRATGWDARLIALAATAAELSAKDQVGMSQEALYGLLRAGLPSDPDKLAHVSAETVGKALAKAAEAGIVDLGDSGDEAIAHFRTFSEAKRLTELTPGSTSSYVDHLRASGLSKAAQDKFAAVYLNHRGSDAELWEKARSAGIAERDVARLQLQGKLALLTYNNPRLITLLERNGRITDPEQLPEHDFHEASTWKAELRKAARNDSERLAELIPPAYEGKKLESRLTAYAEDMARKVRLSFPTHVVARRIERDTGNAFALGATREDTAKLLKAASAEGFRFGETPVAAFMEESSDVRGGLSDQSFEAAKEQVKALARVYQMTPGDDPMPVMMKLGLTAAEDVVAVSKADFVKRYAKKLGGENVATQIHDKARQISCINYNIFTIAKKMDAEVPVAGISAAPDEQQSVKDELIKRYPTLESLFGSLDYCECEHCRSVLSPAAYLVDLLRFIDPQAEVWNSFLLSWKEDHNGQEYPHRENNKALSPYDVLRKRRPDIPCISLTCENTNTALPYIDVVNEILEFYVANNGLTAAAAHDTGGTTTEDLLAEPQNVIAQAYDTLSKARYPLTLPFDLWLSTVREFCDHFETPLSDLLEAFRQGDDLFAPTQPYDRSAIFLEQLGLSPAEAAIFTDTDPLANWWELYGYTSAAAATTSATDPDTGQRVDLNSAKALARRLGVTYKQLVEIVQTAFVNPQLADLVVLNKLGVVTKDLIDYADNKAFYEQNKDLLGKDRASLSEADKARFDALSDDDWTKLSDAQAFEQKLDTLTAQYADSGFDAKAWLAAELQAGGFDDVLLLADPDTGCNFDQTILRYADGDAADAIALLRINLFVRLWRKLGWTIEETDRALQTFVPKDAPFTAANLNKAPLKTALVYMAHLKTLDKRLGVGKQSRLKLITLWSQMATRGANPLYAQLFLTPAVLRSDPVFDDALGNYLSAAGLAAMAEARTHEVSLGNVAPANKLTQSTFAAFPRVTVTYDGVQKVQYLSYKGVLTNSAKAQLAALSTSTALPALLDAVQTTAGDFKLVKGHLPALQGALGLTADQIGDVFTDAGKDIATEALSLDAVSLLYRYALLAKALKLRLADMIALRRLSGLDPFKPVLSAPLAQLSDDLPFTQTLEFVTLAGYVKESGLTIEDLQYLIRHSFDPKGKYRPDTAGMLALIRSLASGIAAIRAEHSVPDEPGTLSDETLRQELGLALPADVVTTLLAMLAGTAEFTATKTGVSPADQLKPGAFADEPLIVEVSYNAIRGEQKLTVRGVLSNAAKNDLKSRLPRPLGTAPFAASTVFSDLLDNVQAEARAFFDKHLLKQPAGFQPATGFLDNADYALLFDPPAANLTQAQQQARLRGQRARLEQAFLPFLQQRLIRQLVVDALTAQLGADRSLTEALVTDKSLLGGTVPLIDGFAATDERGVSVTFLDGTGATLSSKRLNDADTGLKDANGNALKPATAVGATIRGYLEVPATGPYRFYASLDRAAAEAKFSFDHLPDALIDGAAAAASAELSAVIELKAGVPYRFTLELRKLGTGDARLRVQGETLPKDRFSQLTLYPDAVVVGAERAIALLSKVLQLIGALGLGEREVRYLLTHASDFGNLDLDNLPTRAADDTLAGARALFAQVMRLAGYVRLKAELTPDSDELIDVFEANQIDLDTTYDKIAKLTRRKKLVVADTATALASAPTFANELTVRRLWEALQVVERFGVAVDSLTSWTRIVSPQATSDQRFAITSDVKDALKARHDPEAWRRLAQPIFDRQRQRQRDSLVAHVMHKRDFERVEQLYEYFLIDPAMEPVVQTSRIRLAIASVQLFIQRGLLNLEPRVHPSTINSGQWEWMKRYRVWEANRKIFLFPENWLEPEFRDDKTHLFTELEGKLLQEDVSNDLVEDGFLNYLKKLEELARLDIVAMHIEDNADPALNVLHVIGRTFGEPHKYFYRRYAHQMWTPWEPITAEVEGDHLAPVVWRGRLYLFWVTFLEKVEPPKISGVTTEPKLTELKVSDLAGATKAKTIEAHLHWSEYVKGEWSNRESAGPVSATPVFREQVVDWSPSKVFVHVSKEPYQNGQERGVLIHLSGAIDRAFYLAGRNSAPAAAGYGTEDRYGQPEFPLQYEAERITRYRESGDLEVSYRKQVVTKAGKKKREPLDIEKVLNRGLTDSPYTLLPADNDIFYAHAEFEPLIKPFFYQDGQHTLYVQPNVVETITESWTGWIAKNPGIVFDLEKKDVPDPFEELQIVPGIPQREDGVLPIPLPVPDGNGDVYLPIEPEGTFDLDDRSDWLTNSGTALRHDGELIGPNGRIGARVLPAAVAESSVENGGTPVLVHSGSELETGTTVVTDPTEALNDEGLVETASGLNVIGEAGVNHGLLQNVRSRVAAGAGIQNGFNPGGQR